MELTSPRDNLPDISDQYMRESRARTRSYAIAILKKGPGYDPPRSDAIGFPGDCLPSGPITRAG